MILPDTNKTIITIQHTQSVHHTNGHAGAWGDWELTDLGHKQAAEIGKFLKNEGCVSAYAVPTRPPLELPSTRPVA